MERSGGRDGRGGGVTDCSGGRDGRGGEVTDGSGRSGEVTDRSGDMTDRSGRRDERSDRVTERSGEVNSDAKATDGVRSYLRQNPSRNSRFDADVNPGSAMVENRSENRTLTDDQTHSCPGVGVMRETDRSATTDEDFTTEQNHSITITKNDSNGTSPKRDVDDNEDTVSEISDQNRGASKIEEMYVKSDAVDSATKSEAEGSESNSDGTRNVNKSDELAANVSATSDASNIRDDTIAVSIESATETIPSVGFAVLKNRIVLFGQTDDAVPSTSKSKEQATKKCDETTSGRNTRNNVKMAWLESRGPKRPSLQSYTDIASSSQPNTYKGIETTRSGHQATGTSDSKLNLRGDFVVQFKPIIKTRVYDKTANKSELELPVSKVSGNLEGGFTESELNSPKPKNKKTVDLSNVKSPEKKESDLGKRLRDYDSEFDKNCDSDKKKTYKDRIKNISAKIINPCIETIKIITGNEPSEDASSEESSSSNKTSVITTEETDLSDDNQKSICPDSPSDRNDTAFKTSTGNVSFTQAESDENIDNVEETNIRDDTLEYGASSADRLVKMTSKGKLVSDECSEIHTSEDNLSPLEDDDDIIAELLVRKTVSLGDISPKQRDSQKSPSSERAMPFSEENLLAPKSVNNANENHRDRRRKHGLTSSEESVAKSKSESETYTKESWVEFRSESTTASKTGLTSSEDGLTSGESDVSKIKDEVISEDISNRDRIQNLISDNKTIMVRAVGAGISQEHDGIDGIDMRPLPRFQRESESSESGISADTDSSSTVELHRISERLLPIGGSITLIKGKPPSERSTTPSWGSVSSLLDGLTWEKRAADSDKSLTSSLSTLHRETPIQELNQINKDTPLKTNVAPTAEIRSQIREKHCSESDTSSEETRQYKRITCEQVLKGTESDSEEVFMTAHYCIDSVTFGIRRSLSEENLYCIEADTQAHREKKAVPKMTPASSNVFHDRACDACTFLVLLQTLIVRERAIHFAFRKVDACLVHNIGLGSQNAHIFSYLLKRMPPCEFCTFPSVEKMILQLVQSRHGVLMHNAENLAPIYVIFPSYSENNRTIGRVVHLKKKKVSDYAEKPRIRVMMADRYILFPKFHDASVWKKSSLKRHDTPSKRIVSKIKTRNVPVKMDDIPELNENLSIAEEPKPKINAGHKSTKGTPIKKTPSKRKVKKCVLKKWSVEMAATKIQPNRRNGSSSDEPILPNVAVSSSTSNEVIALNNQKRRFILKKWTVKLSPKTKRKISIRKYKELSSEESSNLSKSDVTDKLTIPEIESSDANVDQKEIGGVVLVRKKRPWWKCPKKKKSVDDKKPLDPPQKKKPDFYKKLLHPSYQELFSYRIKSRTGQVETRVLTRQNLLAQRLAYHYIKELTVSRTKSPAKEEEMKIIKPSLTDFQSREYEKRRTFIRDSIESVEQADKQINEEFDDAEDSDELASYCLKPEIPLDVTKYDINEIDYHFETCPIIQEGKTPFKQFLKLQQVCKTTDFKDSWVEYHVEDCSYYLIDGTTVTDIKTVHLVLAEKKEKTCDCAEKLIKGGNIYVKDKSSQTFHHDLCLLFPKQLESGDIDLQSLFNPNIPFREFDENDVFRFYFITKQADTKNRRVVDFCDVPISKFNTVQENIKLAFSFHRNEVETISQFPSKEQTDEIPSTSMEPPKAYRTISLDESFPSVISPPHVDVAELQRFITPPRVDSESEDSTTMYSLEDCLIYASEYLTDDSMSPPPEPLALSDNRIHKQSAESVSLRQFTPSPRPVDHNQADHGTSAKISPQQERSDDKQIYYHLGEFTTQIQKGFSADQRVASPRSLETKDNIADESKGISGQKLSSPTNLILSSPNKVDEQRPHEETKLPLSPIVGAQSQLHTPHRVQSQESTSQGVLPSRQIDDQLRLGHSLDSIQRKRGRCTHLTKDLDTQSLQTEDIMLNPKPVLRHMGSFRQDSHSQRQAQRRHNHSQELISRHCTCKASETMELARRVVAFFEENLEQTGCPYHDAFHEAEILKYRAHSHGDLSRNQGMSIFNQDNERLRQCLSLYDQGFDLLKSAPLRQETKTQNSYPPFERTRGSYQRSRSQDMSSTSREYSLDAEVSPTRVSDLEHETSTSEQPRINNQRTWSHGDLRSKRLSIFNQELRGDVPEAPEPLCMKAVWIPGAGRGREDQCVPQDYVKTGARPKENRFRDPWVRSRPGERFRPSPEDIARRSIRKPGLPIKNEADGNDCPHLWNKWRDGPAPF